MNLEEAGARQTAENEDLTRINEIIHTKLNLPNIEVNNAKRLGTYDQAKVRPIRLIFERIDDKKMILSKAVTLRALEEADQYSRVYIRPDLTKIQLEASKNQQLKQKRLDHPTQYWKIARDRIVEADLIRGRLVEKDQRSSY